jgi:hypothetical protein
MNMDSSMCASSGTRHAWEQLDWPQCERHARRLQARIVKATRAGRWGKVKALQRLLTHSLSGQSLGRETSDGKSRQENARSGWEDMEHSGSQIQSHRIVTTTRVSTATAAPRSHPESQRQVASTRYPDDERPRHASTVFAGVGTHRRDAGETHTPTAFAKGTQHGGRD